MSQCAAAILHTRVSGAISAGARVAASRFLGRKYVSIKAKGRKPTARADRGAESGFAKKDLVPGLARVALLNDPTPARVRPIPSLLPPSRQSAPLGSSRSELTSGVALT